MRFSELSTHAATVVGGGSGGVAGGAGGVTGTTGVAIDAADRWALKAQEEIHGLAVKVRHTLKRDAKGRAAA